MRTPLPNTNAGRLLFHGGGRQGFEILVAPVGSTSFTLTEDDIYSGGFLYNAASTSSQTIELGSVFASQLCLSVIDYDNTYTGINLAGARLTVTIKASDGTTNYTVPFGQFTVDEVKRSANRIDLIALDDFIKFDKAYTETDYPFTEPTSLYDVIEWICSECDVTFGTAETGLTNADYMVKTAPKGTSLTYRQLLSWAAQLTGSCAKFNASTNELEFIWYGQGGGYSVSTDDTFEHNVSSNEILITGILVKQYGKERYTTPNNYYPLTIEDNGLLDLTDDDFITTVIAIFDKTVGTSYFPIALTKVNDPLIEPFDRIEYTNADGDIFYSYATNVNYAFSDVTGIESVGMSEENKSYADGSPFTTEQQAIVGGLQGKLMLKKNVYRKDYLIREATLTDNGLNMIQNASWYYSTDMSKILSSTISGTYTIEITSNDYNFKHNTLYSSSAKSFVFFVDFNNVTTISNYVSQSPTSRQAIGTKTNLVPLGGSATCILIKIDTTNNNWSVVSRKSIDGAKLSIYKSIPTELIEYVEDDTLDFDVEPTEDSENFISSGSVYDSLESKQDALIFDYEPTDGSENPVMSDGIYQSLQAKQDTLEFDTTPTSGSTKPVTSDGIKSALDGKQNTLTFDSTPTANSNNPVTSKGIKTALDGKIDNPQDYNPDTGEGVNAGKIPVKMPTGFEWIFDSCFYGTFEVIAGEDLNADKFWTDRARFYMNGETNTHVVNRPNNFGGLCFVINLGGLGTATKYQVYMTRDNACDIYVRYRNGTAAPQAWKHINMT